MSHYMSHNVYVTFLIEDLRYIHRTNVEIIS
nr:MAG TPA: hypothetical protein [Caudoviricetes sp.]